jgi:hypothetical protein
MVKNAKSSAPIRFGLHLLSLRFNYRLQIGACRIIFFVSCCVVYVVLHALLEAQAILSLSKKTPPNKHNLT